VERLAKDGKLSACGRQPIFPFIFLSLYFVCLFVVLLLLCFSGQVSIIHVWGSILLWYTQLTSPIGYCISSHIGGNVSF